LKVRGGWLLSIGAVAGACTMAVEISAVRMLAPWFGTSLVVWTNVLEVILLGLTIGYLWGARLCTARSPLRPLAFVLAFGAVLTGWLPAIAAPVCRTFIPDGLALHDAAPLLFWGSFASAMVLFLPSAAVLGMVGPLLVEEIQRRGAVHAGTAGGRVLAASTLGSVLGAFATSHVLLPHPLFGLSRTFVLAGGALLACAAIAFVLSRVDRERSRLGDAAFVLLVALALPIAVASRLELPALDEGLTELDGTESVYQSVRVVEDERWGAPLRYLQVNEGFDSYQSVWRAEPGLLGEGFYYDDFLLPVCWGNDLAVEPAGNSRPWNVLVLGFGAGTVQRVLAGAAPDSIELSLVGVELDSAIVALGRRWFDLADDGPRLTVYGGMDARFALRGIERMFDQVVLDAYANQVEIPPHLSTVEFFGECRTRLTEGGWLVANVGGFGFDDPVVDAVASTLAYAFGQPVLALRVPSARNFSLFVRRGARPPRPGEPGWRFPGPLGEALLDAREVEGGWSWTLPPAAPPLTDDRNAIDKLQVASLREGRERLHGGR
jgi:predicted membrane-bound spermidine synthase